MTAALEGRGLRRQFGPVTAVDGVDLEIMPGEFFALLGPSGCGKTTLLRIFAGFETPDQGSVLVNGADVTALKPNRRPLNMMFQSYALFPHMTVWRNVTYGLEMERLEEAEIRKRAGETLEVTGLTDLEDRKPHELSGGQRQRVALARALVKRPKVLLLDEPLSALDRGLREQMQVELKRAQKEAGIAFVVVTHDQEEALGLADRVAVMQGGRIRQIGTPREVYDAPEDEFVAGFVGSNNILPVAVLSMEMRTRLARTLGPIESDRQIAIRPERLALVTTQPGADTLYLKIKILETVYHGADLIVAGEAGDTRRPLTVRLSAGAADRIQPKRGDDLYAVVEPIHVRVLAPDATGAGALGRDVAK
ncbi:MAG: ABC transporter ATP-binding protein [Hyphomicrobiaceae bacterium]